MSAERLQVRFRFDEQKGVTFVDSAPAGLTTADTMPPRLKVR